MASAKHDDMACSTAQCKRERSRTKPELWNNRRGRQIGKRGDDVTPRFEQSVKLEQQSETEMTVFAISGTSSETKYRRYSHWQEAMACPMVSNSNEIVLERHGESTVDVRSRAR